MLWRFAKPACRGNYPWFCSSLISSHPAMSYIVPLCSHIASHFRAERVVWGQPFWKLLQHLKIPEGHVAHRSTVSSWLGWDMMRHIILLLKWSVQESRGVETNFDRLLSATVYFHCQGTMSVSLRPTYEPDPENICRNGSRSLNIIELSKAIISKCRKTIKATWIHLVTW